MANRCYEINQTTPQDTQGNLRVYFSNEQLANDYPWLEPALRVLPIGATVTISSEESSLTANVVESHVDADTRALAEDTFGRIEHSIAARDAFARR